MLSLKISQFALNGGSFCCVPSVYCVRWYCKIVLNTYFIKYLYCATLCQIFLLHCYCPYLHKNDLFELLMIELIQMEIGYYFH